MLGTPWHARTMDVPADVPNVSPTLVSSQKKVAASLLRHPMNCSELSPRPENVTPTAETPNKLPEYKISAHLNGVGLAVGVREQPVQSTPYPRSPHVS